MRYRHLRRTVIAVLAAAAFILTLGLLVRLALNAAPTRRAAVHWIERIATGYGVELEIGELRWNLLPPGIELHDVYFASSNIEATVQTLHVDLGRMWLTRRTVELGTVAARGVDVRLVGLPPRGRGGGGPLKIEIRHLELVDVSFEGRELPGKMALAVDNLRAGWTTSNGISRGYADVPFARLQFGRKKTTFETELRARYELEEGAARLSNFTAEGDGFTVEGRGRLARGAARVEATANLDLGWLDRVIDSKARLDGRADLEIVLDTSQPIPLVVAVEAPRVETVGFTVDAVSGRLELSRDKSLRGILERGRYRGGLVRGDYRLDDIGGRYAHRVDVESNGVELAGLLRDIGVEPAGLGSRLDVSLDLSWDGKALGLGFGHADTTLRAAGAGMPVAGALVVDLEGDRMLRFDASDLALGSSILQWQGTLELEGWEPAWSIISESADLGEVSGLVNAWVGSQVLPAEIDGTGSLDVTLSGPFSALIVNARVDAQPLRLPPIVIDHLVADATIGGDMLRIGTARLQIGDGYGEIGGGLAWGEAAGTEQIDLTTRGHGVPVAAVARWAGLEEWVDRGNMTFDGRLGGSLELPRGRWLLDLDGLGLGGLDVGAATAEVELADGRLTVLDLHSDRGLQADVWWDVIGAAVGGHVAWPEMSLAPLGPTLTSLVAPSADIALDFELPFDAPVTGTLQAVSDRARLAVIADTDSVAVSAQVTGALDGSAMLERGEGGRLVGSGELDLTSATALLDLLAPDAGVPLTGSGHATFDVRWSDEPLPTVSGILQSLDLSLDEQPIRLIEPAPFDLSGDGLSLPGLQLKAREDELFVRWGIDNQGALRGNLAGTMDALLLRFLLPDWEPAGRATGVVELLGTTDQPLVEGIAQINRGSFRLPGTRTILSQVQGTVLLSSGEVELEGVDARLMGGRVRCNGRIFERNGRLILTIGGTASGVRYEPLPTLSATISGDWRLTGPVEDLGLSGELEVDRMSLDSNESAANILLSWLPQRERASGEGGLRLDLHIESEETIELRSPFVRLNGSASLDVSGTSNEPGLVGQVEIVEGGEATLLGNRYEIERASVSFSNPQTIEPFFDVQASTWVQEYQVTVNLSGTFDNFVTTAVSTPPLSSPEIYSLLGVGYRREDLGAGAVGLGVASSILTSELTSVLSQRAQLVLPVDQVRVDPFAADSTGNPTARLSVIKQLTPYWTVILQTTLSGEREQIVTSRWYLAPGLFIEAAQREDDSYSVDLKLRRPY